MYRGKTFLILESDKNMMYNKINNRPAVCCLCVRDGNKLILVVVGPHGICCLPDSLGHIIDLFFIPACNIAS